MCQCHDSYQPVAYQPSRPASGPVTRCQNLWEEPPSGAGPEVQPEADHFRQREPVRL